MQPNNITTSGSGFSPQSTPQNPAPSPGVQISPAEPQVAVTPNTNQLSQQPPRVVPPQPSQPLQGAVQSSQPSSSAAPISAQTPGVQAASQLGSISSQTSPVQSTPAQSTGGFAPQGLGGQGPQVQPQAQQVPSGFSAQPMASQPAQQFSQQAPPQQSYSAQPQYSQGGGGSGAKKIVLAAVGGLLLLAGIGLLLWLFVFSGSISAQDVSRAQEVMSRLEDKSDELSTVFDDSLDIQNSSASEVEEAVAGARVKYDEYQEIAEELLAEKALEHEDVSTEKEAFSATLITTKEEIDPLLDDMEVYMSPLLGCFQILNEISSGGLSDESGFSEFDRRLEGCLTDIRAQESSLKTDRMKLLAGLSEDIFSATQVFMQELDSADDVADVQAAQDKYVAAIEGSQDPLDDFEDPLSGENSIDQTQGDLKNALDDLQRTLSE